MDEHEEPFGWWGWHWQPAVPMSIMQIIDAGSTDTDMMAVLWAMLARRASILVAAEPPMAGKTTTLTALLDLMPPESRRVYLRGHYETFDFTNEKDIVPANTYVLANEMSDHLAVYLWGSRIYKTFELIPQGYAIGSTMHAETVTDVIAILDSEPLCVPTEWIARLTLVVNLYVSSTYGGATRRFSAVHMLEPSSEANSGSEHTLPISRSPVRGVRPVLLSRWDRATDSFDHHFTRPEIVDKLSRWAGTSTTEWSKDVAQRKAYLEEMQGDGIRGIAATRSSIAKF